MVTIYKPQVIQPSKFEFKVTFMYDDQNLETPPFPNASRVVDVKDSIRQLIADYDLRRDTTNLDRIKNIFTGDSVEL